MVKDMASLWSPIGESPLVSCVIIFYNNQSFLGEAIDSVLAQTYTHWELFLVDDGSTDGSTQIAQQYVQHGPQRVHYLHHAHRKNRGKNCTRNLGIQQAKGDLIALLDGDDIWLPQKLKEQVEVFQYHPQAGMVYGRSQCWYSWAGTRGSRTKDTFADDLGVPPNTLVQPPALALEMLYGANQTPTTCNAIWRKEVLEAVGGFDESYRDIFEDQAFFIKIELQFPVFVADNCWAKYRQHADSSLAQFNLAGPNKIRLKYTTRLAFLRWVKRYLQDQSYQDVVVWAYLQRRLQIYQTRLWWLKVVPIYHLWFYSLENILRIGRAVLPKTWRKWLWQTAGKRLYFGSQ